jgi:hypothetical protein
MQNKINHLVVFRQLIGARTTLGQFYLNGEFAGYSLEDTVRPRHMKVYGETAIPDGMYPMRKYISSRFGACLAIDDVPNFTHIRIHGLNDHTGTLGCIGIGKNRDIEKMRISNCRVALDELISRIDNSKPSYITIVNAIGIK